MSLIKKPPTAHAPDGESEKRHDCSVPKVVAVPLKALRKEDLATQRREGNFVLQELACAIRELFVAGLKRQHRNKW